ncbi:Protein of unknown function [Devosia lucknowensis]|uniref:DUF3060 domain-containing protein n=1 Tax=Devosia lucknowensis TaxID=1096929 RepID=A0A1Y6F8K5_9HYPH|nr:DUF3060 domain-containing protein [Devosia lucknowensis]SMQ71185.1 Protein of unknown function [Devosia lucknowensis]
MRFALPLALLLAMPVAAHAQTAETQDADEVVIEGVSLSRDIPCEGQNIGIYGADNRIHLTGNCGKVIVHGDGHEVSIEKAVELAVSGAGHVVNAGHLAKLVVDTAGNTVNATMASDGADAQVEIAGAEQVLNLDLASATDISINGTEQVLNWSLADGAPEPRIDMGGIDNAANRID